jgi:hypothetical protein
MRKVTYQNVSEVGNFVKETSHNSRNEIITARIFEVDGCYYKKIPPSWLNKGRLVKMAETEPELIDVIR